MNKALLNNIYREKLDIYLKSKNKNDDILKKFKSYDNGFQNGQKIFIDDYYFDIISSLEYSFGPIEKEIETQLMFTISNEDFKDILIKTNTDYENNEYANLYDLSNFIEDAYNINTVVAIWHRVYNNQKDYFTRWSQNGMQEDFKFDLSFKESMQITPNKNPLDFYYNEINKIENALYINLKLITIKSKINRSSNNNLNSYEILENKYNLVFKSDIAYTFFKFCLSSFKTLTDTIISWYYETFEVEGYILKDCRKQFKDMISEEFNYINPRIREFSNEQYTSKHLDEFKNQKIDFEKKFNITF